MMSTMEKITGYFGRVSESSEAHLSEKDESPPVDGSTPVVPAVTSPRALTTSHEVAVMSPCGESTGKKRIPSDSPSALSGVVSNKQRLTMLNDSLTDLLGDDPTFEEDTPYWVPLIFKSMGAIREEVQAVSAKMDSYELFKAEVIEKVAGLNTTVDSLKVESDAMKAEMQSIKKENAELKETVCLLINQVDHNEQHSRSECLLLHGVPESKNRTVPENSKVVFAAEVSTKVGVALSEKNIKRAHRYGPPRRDGKPRPIIARFWDANIRNSVYTKKKNLKGKNIYITENLTKRRLKLLNEAYEKFGKNNVWTREGRIYGRDGDGQVINIVS